MVVSGWSCEWLKPFVRRAVGSLASMLISVEGL